MKKAVSILMTICLLCTLCVPAFAAGYGDAEGHWAESAIDRWSEAGIVEGADGAFRPNDAITRAEMATVLGRLMQYVTAAKNSFTDVPADAWYTQSVLKANAAGIMKGDGTGTMRPTANITRQEAIVLLGRALGVTEDAAKAAVFTDAASIAEWAKGYVGGMSAAGYVNGSDGKVNPRGNITRAEVVTILDNAVSALYDTAGSYTADAAANVIISVPGVTLKDMTIKGNLIIAEGVGAGDFTLDNVKVEGNTVVRGGGEHSIIIKGNSQLSTVVVERRDGKVRVSVQGDAEVEVIYVDDGSDEIKIEGAVGTVEVAASDVKVEVTGTVENLNVTGVASAAEVNVAATAKVTNVTTGAPNTKLEVAGSVQNLTVSESAAATEIATKSGAKITNVATGADNVAVTGPGRVENMTVTGGQGTTVAKETTVKNVENKGDSPVDVAGKDVPTGGTGSNTGTTGGGGGGYVDSRSSLPTDYLLVAADAKIGESYAFTGNNTYYPATVAAGKAFPTIADAVAAAKAGDTVYVTAGTYKTYAEITKPIHLIGAGADKVTLTAAEGKAFILVLGNVVEYGVSLADLQVEGFTFQTPGENRDDAAIYLTGKGSEEALIVIKDNTFSGTGDQAVALLTPYSAAIEYVFIGDNTIENMKYGMYFNSIKFLEIKNNIIKSTKYNAINIAADTEGYPAQNVLITDNTMTGISSANYDAPEYASGIHVGPYHGDKIAIQDNDITMLNGKLPVLIQAAGGTTEATVNGVGYATIEAALTEAKAGDTVHVVGTVGGTNDYKSYDVDKAVTIQGGTVYGCFNLLADGAVLDGLTIYSRGGGSDAMKNAVNIVAAEATVKNCKMELNKEKTDEIGNAIVIYPTAAQANYTITDNTITGYQKTDGTWGSSGISVAEGLDYSARFPNVSNGKSVADCNIDDETIALGNAYKNCKNEYVRVDWTNGGNGNYKYGYFDGGYSSQFGNSTGDAKMLLAGEVSMEKTVTYPTGVTIELLEGAAITIAENAIVTVAGTINVPEKATLTVSSGSTLTISGTMNLDGSLVNNGTLSGDGTIRGYAANIYAIMDKAITAANGKSGLTVEADTSKEYTYNVTFTSTDINATGLMAAVGKIAGLSEITVSDSTATVQYSTDKRGFKAAVINLLPTEANLSKTLTVSITAFSDTATYTINVKNSVSA